MVEVRNLKKSFPARRHSLFGKQGTVKAVDKVAVEVAPGDSGPTLFYGGMLLEGTVMPVVPVAMKNSQVTRKAGLPWIDHPVVVIGKPLDFSEFYGRGDDPRVLRWVTDQVMAAIHDLSGQTYIEAYCTSVKSGSLTSTEADARILERPGINTRPPEPPAAS